MKTKKKFTNSNKNDLIAMLTSSSDSKESQPSNNSKQKRSELIELLSGEKTPKEQTEEKTLEENSQVSEVNSSGESEKFDPSKSLNRIVDLVFDITDSQDRINQFISEVKTRSLQLGTNRKSAPPKVNRNLNLPKKKSNDVFLIHWNGRFGNRMHTYAYLKNRATMLNGELFLPSDWEGKFLFKNLDYSIIEDDELRSRINQTAAEFDTFDSRIAAVENFSSRSSYDIKYISPDNPNETYKKYNQAVAIDSVSAYHSKIFKHMKLSDVLKWYEFNDEVKNLDIYKRLEDIQGTYDIAHLRRDDISDVNYSSNGGYSTISKEAYEKCFSKYGFDPKEIQWTSDDWANKWGVGNAITQGLINNNQRSSWRYPEGTSYTNGVIFDWLPDFLRLYFARTIFRANSSFSFWACTLAKGRETPPKIFAPRLDKRVLYAETREETIFNFEEGNHPHWLCITGKDSCDDILFSDEVKPKK
jgi:hypothetical protein